MFCSPPLYAALEGWAIRQPSLEEPHARLGLLEGLDWLESTRVLSPFDVQDDDFVTRDDFDDTDQLRIGNDGIFMLTFFSEYMVEPTGFQGVTPNSWSCFHITPWGQGIYDRFPLELKKD